MSSPIPLTGNEYYLDYEFSNARDDSCQYYFMDYLYDLSDDRNIRTKERVKELNRGKESRRKQKTS